METTERLCELVKLEEDSTLKQHLNAGIISLFEVPETMIRPHICLNGEEGFEVLQKIRMSGVSAKTEALFFPHIIQSCDEVWLNVWLFVYCEERTQPTCCVRLSPQQTGHILKNLPPASQQEALAKIKRWYFGEFLVEVQKGFETITKQFQEGNPFLESDHNNRIFDIHGGRGMKDIPYTETDIVGENLYWAIVHSGTWCEHGADGYEQADNLITQRRNRQKEAVSDLLALAKTFR